ncbi:MAG: HD-GYP domain-containing protein [Phycisphaerales bacterium]
MHTHDLSSMVDAIARKDMATAAHTWRVVLYTRAMADAARLDHPLVERLTRAAAVHDLGKLAIPDEILQKPGPLLPAERAVMETHAAEGHRMLIGAGEDDPVVLGLVRHHHERLDGSGYPDRLAGEAIPLAARYFAVIDAFDAMTSVRPYRSEIGAGAAERALAELRARADWYCEESVALLERLFRAGELTWILQYHNDLCPLPALQGPFVRVPAGRTPSAPAR